MKQCGVYAIENAANGHCYIGSSVNLTKRMNTHRRDLRKGQHHSQYLQRAWNKYGESLFVFTVLMSSPESDLLEWEQAFIDEWRPEYNVNPVAANPPSSKGKHFTAEHRARISAASKGKPKTYKAWLGRHHSPETRARLSAANKGHSPSAETRAKLSKAGMGNQRARRQILEILGG